MALNEQKSIQRTLEVDRLLMDGKQENDLDVSLPTVPYSNNGNLSDAGVPF